MAEFDPCHRCLHLDKKGRQCHRRAEPGENLCYFHLEDAENPTGPGPGLRKLLLRLAAAILLLVFAVQTYRMIRALLSELPF